MSDVTSETVADESNYYHGANGQIYKADEPLNAGDTIIPFPSPGIDAHITPVVKDIIEDRIQATVAAEALKYLPGHASMKIAHMMHRQNNLLQELKTENNTLKEELSETQMNMTELQRQLAEATAPQAPSVTASKL